MTNYTWEDEAKNTYDKYAFAKMQQKVIASKMSDMMLLNDEIDIKLLKKYLASFLIKGKVAKYYSYVLLTRFSWIMDGDKILAKGCRID